MKCIWIKMTETRWQLSCRQNVSMKSNTLRNWGRKRVTLIFLYFTSPGVRGRSSESRALLQLRSPKCASYSHTWNDKRGEKIFIAVIYDLATRSVVVDSCASKRGVSSTRLGDFAFRTQLSTRMETALLRSVNLLLLFRSPSPTQAERNMKSTNFLRP